jgi:hypothetical protein
MQYTVVTDTSATRRIGGPQGKKTGQSGMANQTIWFPGRKQLFMVIRMGEER